MNKIISDGIKHFKARAARYRELAEKAEAEVARLEAYVQRQAAQQSAQVDKAHCTCVDFINCNPDPVPNPDCRIHGALRR